MPGVVNSLVFSVIGIVVLILAFAIVDILTKQYHLWREIIEKQNIALAILLGSFLIGVALVIAAAVHG
jgi:uncharacterized membrane protein YjfL (UPF0719 family)